MSDQPFITPPLSIVLDAVRGAAALVVLCGHAAQMGIYDFYPFDLSAQHIAVIVFFVLSGLVIAHSAQGGKVDLTAYAAARIARIVPVALVAVGFSLLAALYGRALGIEYVGDGPNLANVILPLLFLSESAIGQTLVWNPPFWSLAYEVWYYALFGAAVFLTGRQRWLWCALLALIAGAKVLLLLPVWLIGVALAKGGARLHAPLSLAPLVLAGGGGLIWLADSLAPAGAAWLSAASGMSLATLDHSQEALTDVLSGLGVAAIFIGAAPLARQVAPVLERCKRPVRAFANMSFSLYVLHWPMLVLLAAYGVVAGESVAGTLLILGGVIGVCAMVAARTEARSPEIRMWLERWLRQRRVAAPLPA